MPETGTRGEASPASLWLRRAAGAVILGGMIRLVTATSRIVYEPSDALDRLRELMPFILCCWHGQGFLAFTTLIVDKSRMNLLISRHPDGQIAAGAARAFWGGLIEGSGANYKQPTGTGGMAAMRQMLKALQDGESVALTADIPPEPGRKASEGIALMARISGRPIIPFNISTSRRRIVESQWDKVQINYPFSRLAVVLGEPIWVPGDARDLTPHTQKLANELDQTLARAFEIADGAEPVT